MSGMVVDPQQCRNEVDGSKIQDFGEVDGCAYGSQRALLVIWWTLNNAEMLAAAWVYFGAVGRCLGLDFVMVASVLQEPMRSPCRGLTETLRGMGP